MAKTEGSEVVTGTVVVIRHKMVQVVGSISGYVTLNTCIGKKNFELGISSVDLLGHDSKCVCVFQRDHVYATTELGLRNINCAAAVGFTYGVMDLCYGTVIPAVI